MSSSIIKTVTYEHPIEKVWAAISDARGLSTWLMPCNFKPELGFKFQFTTKPAPGFDGIINCEVLRLEPPHLLEFSWSGGSLNNTKVTFSLTPLSPNRTRLDFEHSGFEGLMNKLLVKRILARGWKKKILNVNLKKFLANG